MPCHQERGQIEADGVGALSVQRGTDQLPLPASRSRNQGRTHRRCERHAHRMVADAAPLKWRCVTGARE